MDLEGVVIAAAVCWGHSSHRTTRGCWIHPLIGREFPTCLWLPRITLCNKFSFLFYDERDKLHDERDTDVQLLLMYRMVVPEMRETDKKVMEL